MYLAGGGQYINLDPYQLDLITQFHEGKSYPSLVRWLREEPREVQEDLKRRIKILYFQVGLDDKDMLIELKRQGFHIGPYTLVRLRFQLGLRRRIRDPTEQKEAESVVQALIKEGLQSGAIDGYGKQYLYIHFRQMGMNIARDRMFQVYRTMNPAGIERREKDLQRTRGEYIVRGPNYIWSVDGHEKLKPYGFEIYACIDAYSRYIIWIYVGISAGTAVSVGQQYLGAVRQAGVVPQFIRSDCGKETGQLAYAQFTLSQENEPSINFQDCYMYGTSTANQRIESWWQQLSKSLLFRWRVCCRRTI
jgi:hypothetical protein